MAKHKRELTHKITPKSKTQIKLEQKVFDDLVALSEQEGLVNNVFYLKNRLSINILAAKLGQNKSKISKIIFKDQAHNVDENALLTVPQITEACLELGVDAETSPELNLINFIKHYQKAIENEPQEPRGPVVTVMGHVDHGKSTLLEQYRKIAITKKEFGGITQHIGAYTIENSGKQITFIDTPGHAAFTAMRAQGSAVADVVVLVVAANDGVQPQTKEAISHARVANVPLIVFFNKMDLANADLDAAILALSQEGIVLESFGGDVPMIQGSALKGEGLTELLETIILVSDIQELKTHPNVFATGTILESQLDRALGSTATLLVRDGTLANKEFIITNKTSGRMRSLVNDQGRTLQEVKAGTPVLAQSFNDIPLPGSPFIAVSSEKMMQQIMHQFVVARAKNIVATTKRLTLEELMQNAARGNDFHLNLIIKADVQGSLEVIKAMIPSIPKVNIMIVHTGVGEISGSDITLADVVHAQVIGFNVKINSNARRQAEQAGVKINFYNVVYELINYIKDAAKALFGPEYQKKVTGKLRIKQIFQHSKIGKIAGCAVLEGKINRNSKIDILRDGEVILTTEVSSLRYGPQDIKEATSGHDCGLVIKNFDNIETDDIIEAYNLVII